MGSKQNGITLKEKGKGGEERRSSLHPTGNRPPTPGEAKEPVSFSRMGEILNNQLKNNRGGWESPKVDQKEWEGAKTCGKRGGGGGLPPSYHGPL